jgi:hypothetical protein
LQTPNAAIGETDCEEPRSLCNVELVADTPAPFSGQLLTPRLAAELVVDFGQARERCAAKVRLADDQCAARLSYLRDERNAALAATEFWQSEAKRLDAWYRSPLFIALVTASSVAAMIVAIR